MCNFQQVQILKTRDLDCIIGKLDKFISKMIPPVYSLNIYNSLRTHKKVIFQLMCFLAKMLFIAETIKILRYVHQTLLGLSLFCC